MRIIDYAKGTRNFAKQQKALERYCRIARAIEAGYDTRDKLSRHLGESKSSLSKALWRMRKRGMIRSVYRYEVTRFPSSDRRNY